MNDEIEFGDGDAEFGDFDDEAFEHFDEFEEIEPSEVKMQTAVLSKNNLIALLCIKTAEQGGAICRVDPREDRPSVQVYDDPQKALEWFARSLRTSRENGWQVVYSGLPLQG